MTRSCTLLACACFVLSAWQPAAACNPDPPRPAILEGHRYDDTAAEYLVREARSVIAARLALRLDLELGVGGSPGGPGSRADYVFDVLEGWQAQTPRRVTIGGHWVSCALALETGRVFLLYLDGERLLYAVPAEELDFELTLLGEPDWFYDARGRLVAPVED
jgi:hypothetical protein